MTPAARQKGEDCKGGGYIIILTFDFIVLSYVWFSLHFGNFSLYAAD